MIVTDVISIWSLDFHRIDLSGMAWRDILDIQELEKVDRIKIPEVKQQAMVSAYVRRDILARVSGCDPADIRFHFNA